MTAPGWYPNELTHAGPEHLDPEYVSGYDRKAGGDLKQEIDLLYDLGLGKDHTVIDFGAGSGTFAMAFAPYCRRVIAIDVSPAMLAIMKRKIHEHGVDNIECVHAGFLSYVHDGDPADFVYSRNALHHLPDFWKAIALVNVAGVLKPGGILRLHDLVYSFEPNESSAVFETWLSTAPERPEAGWTRAELETHIQEEFSTFSWLLEPMLERAGFSVQSVNHTSSRVFSAYTCVKTA